MASFNPIVRGALAKKLGYSLADGGEDYSEDADSMEDDKTPYESLAKEGSTPDITPGIVGQTDMKSAMADFDQQQAALNQARSAGRESNLATNLGSVFSNLATGKPQDQSALYSTINAQNKEANADMAGDLTRRANVMKAVQMAQAKAAGLKAQNDRHEEDVGIKKNMAAAYAQRTQAIAGNQANRIGTANIRAASGLFKDPTISKEVTKLNSASSAQTLIDEIRAGKLTDSNNIKNQLTNLLTQIELGAPGGQGDRHNMGIDTLYGRAQNALSFIEGSPNKTIPKEYLDQIEQEAHALKGRAASNYKNLTDAAISGSDLSMGDSDADPGQVAKLAKQRQSQFLKSVGVTGNTLSGFPKTVTNGSHQATVNNQQEADEAAKEGFH